MDWREWQMLDRGYEIRYEKQLDMMRNIMSALFNTAFGAKKKINPKSIVSLPLIDVTQAVKLKKVSKSSLERALKILNK